MHGDRFQMNVGLLFKLIHDICPKKWLNFCEEGRGFGTEGTWCPPCLQLHALPSLYSLYYNVTLHMASCHKMGLGEAFLSLSLSRTIVGLIGLWEAIGFSFLSLSFSF